MKTKKLITLMVTSVVCFFAAFALSFATKANAQTEIDVTGWKTYADAAINVNTDGNIQTTNGAFYSVSPMPTTYDADENTMRLDLKFSVEKTGFTTHQLVFLVTNTPIARNSDYSAKYKASGTDNGFIGFQLYYQTEARYNSKSALFRVTDDKGANLTANYLSLNHDGTSVHSAEWIFTKQGVSVSIDGVPLTVSSSESTVYNFKKSDGTLYTIDDFLTEGKPAVYFCADEGYSYKTTIYTPVAPAVADKKGWALSDGKTPVYGSDKVTVSSSVNLYNTLPLSGTYYDPENKILKIRIDFSMTRGEYGTGHNIIYFSPKKYEKFSASDSLEAVRLYYNSEDSYKAGKQVVRIYNGGVWQSALIATNCFPTANNRHYFILTCTESGVTAEFDSVKLAGGYEYLKSDKSTKYTIDDFLTDGKPTVYFAVQNTATTFTVYNSREADVAEKTVAFDGTAWNNHSDVSVIDLEGDKISVNGGLYYKEKIGEVNYDRTAKTMRINVKFSLNALNQYSQQFVPFITSEKITDWNGGWKKVGNSSDTIALRMYYASEWRYNNASLFARVCDYKNYSTSGYVAINPADNAEHTLTFVMDSASVYVEVDGNGVETAQNSKVTYLCKKSATENYTINDFLKNGEPSVYFGVLCNPEFGSATINGNFVSEESLASLIGTSLTANGASVRLGSPTGLRFENSVNASHYGYLAKTFGEENVILGTLIIPADLTESTEITVNTDKVLNGIRTTWKTGEAGTFCAVLSEIPQEYYGRNILSRAYIAVSDENGVSYYYGAPIIRSIGSVAKAILDDYDKTTSASADSPATRTNEYGYDYLVTYDGGLTYVYGKVEQAQVDILLGMCGEYPMNLYLGETARSTIKSVYDSCAVVYSSKDGGFSKKAAEKFNGFLNEACSGVSAVCEKNSFSGFSDGTLVVNITVKSETSAQSFTGESYGCKIRKGEIDVYANSPQGVYFATGKLMSDVLKSDANVISNVPQHVLYEENFSVLRSEYIKDITLFNPAWENEYTPLSAFMDFAEKRSSFAAADGRAMVVGHRGDMEYYPENSIEGIISAIKKGADAVEIDCALTKDGVWVLNHGSSLNPNTDYSLKKGAVVEGVVLPESPYVFDWTYEQLTKLNLRFGNGRYASAESEISPYKIATLKEALIAAKGKCFVVMDQLYRNVNDAGFAQMDTLGSSNPYWPSVRALIAETGAYESVLFAYLGLTKGSIEPLRTQLEQESGSDLISLFDRTGTHNTVISWYGEFDCNDYDALYSGYISDGVYQGNEQTPPGTYLLVNRIEKAIDFVNRRYFS